jgi:hypothetical protein
VTVSGGVATGFVEFQYRIVGQSRWSPPGQINGASGATTITGLSTTSAYEVRARAVNTSTGGGTSGNWSAYKSVGTSTPLPVPSDISDLALSSPTTSSLTVTFTTATNAQSHEYRLSTNGGSTWGAAQSLIGSVITGLLAATTYHVQVRGVNSTGAGNWSHTGSDTTSSISGTASIRAVGTIVAELGDSNGTYALSVPAPAGVAPNDLVVIATRSQDPVTVPAGWTSIIDADVSTWGGHVQAIRRTWQSGDSMPVLTSPDGRAGNDLTAVAIAFQNATDIESVSETGEWNIARSTLAGVAVTTTGADRIVVNLIGFDAFSDAGGAAYVMDTPATWTKSAERASADGHRDVLTVLTKVQAAAAAVAAPTLTVTANGPVVGEYNAAGFAVF